MGDEHLLSLWIAREIIPHERAVVRWLARRWGHLVDIEDVVQEAYCRIANLPSVSHIENPGAYFFRTAHSIVSDIMRRRGIVGFVSLSQIEWSAVNDTEPLPDRIMEGCENLRNLQELLAELPETYRNVIELRRVEGLSRKETAERLGLSETVVKNALVRGLQKLMKANADQEAELSGDDDRDEDREKVRVSGKRRPHQQHR